jgi:hypothetical protein
VSEQLRERRKGSTKTSEPFFFELGFELFKIDSIAFSASGSAIGLYFKATVEQPAYIKESDHKKKTYEDRLNHTSKISIRSINGFSTQIILSGDVQ